MKKNLVIHIMLLFSYGLSAQGLYNNGGKIVIGTGVFINLSGTDGNLRNESNVSDGSIDLTGKLIIQGNITNNVSASDIFINTSAESEVVFAGVSPQIVGGSTVATLKFNNLTINNSSGINFAINAQVDGIITFTNGPVEIGNNNFIFGPSSDIAGVPSATSMIIATGSGQVQKLYSGIGTFTFPVGDNNVTAEYSPVSINFTAGTFAPAAFTGLNLVNSKYVDPSITGSYLNRHWNISQAGITGFLCEAVFKYEVADVVGTEANIYTLRVNPGPVTSFDPANTVLHQLTATGLTSFGIFTGGPRMITQLISLASGWNIFSFAVEPNNMSMKAIVDPLITAGTLIKIQDELGNAIEKLPDPIGWVDFIGQMRVSEGYKIKLATNTDLGATGKPVTSPYNISLNTGWNIMGYPIMSTQAALTVFDPLITTGSLLKVQDELGNAIEKLPDPIGWVDFIHNLSHGNGYKVKTNINTVLTINNAAKGEYQNIETPLNQPTHFKLPYIGNGLDHMNIYIYPTLGGLSLKAGDEIGVFDGEICVGAAVINDVNLKYINVTVSMDDPTSQNVDGYSAGNSFNLKLWDNQTGLERKPQEVELYKGYKKLFERLGTSVLKVNFEPGTVSTLGDAFPNPSTDRTTFNFELFGETDVRFEIYNIMGDLVKVLTDRKMPGGNHVIEWDNRLTSGIRAKSGIYFYRLQFNGFLQTKQLIIR